ncbi:MAG: Cyclophilin type peptidyl-prolyl cis-trans isomerase/CLD, partial [Planctomycetota bacterium]
VVGEFYSSVAPFHVANFVKLAKDGYYPGTSFSSFRRGNLKSNTAAGQTAVNVGLEFADPMTKVTPDNRDDDGTKDIGYSVRDEANSLPYAAGSLVAVQDWNTGGDSASRLAVYAEEPAFGYGTIFARVTDEASLKVLRDMLAADGDAGNTIRIKSPFKIKSVTVEGAIANPPETPFPPAFKMPEAEPAKK